MKVTVGVRDQHKWVYVDHVITKLDRQAGLGSMSVILSGDLADSL